MNTLASSFLIGSSSFLQVTRTIIKAWMSMNFGQIQRLTTELAALEHLKDLYSCIFNIIRLGTKHKKTYWMTHTQFTGKGSDKGLYVYR